MRHIDFQRIYDEFCSYYKNHAKGKTEYYDWLTALSLDEAQPYGHARESFQWAKDMLRLISEDAENKYYGCVVSLPIRSMNGNVYHERDLIAAATTIEGKSPSINHKDEFWLSVKNPRNRWGPPVTIEGSKYEDGANEVVIKVPKATICPVCTPSNKPLYRMIDEKRVVNLSLEGTMNGAFEYSDPPFTLLTSDVFCPGSILKSPTTLYFSILGSVLLRSSQSPSIFFKYSKDPLPSFSRNSFCKCNISSRSL